MSCYIGFPLLVNFALETERKGPLAMNVPTLPNQDLMFRIISETVAPYTRGRSNAALTLIKAVDKPEPAMELVDLENLSKEPTAITRAPFAKALAQIFDLCKQKSTMAVRQKFIESWAMDVVHSHAGIPPGTQPTRHQGVAMSTATRELMTTLRPSKVSGISDQNILRARYRWTLLATLTIRIYAHPVLYI